MQDKIKVSKYVWDIFKKYKLKIILYFLLFNFFGNLTEIFVLPYLLEILGNSFQLGTLTINKALIIVFIYSILFCYHECMSYVLFWKYLIYDFCFKVETEFKLKLFSYAVKHSINYFNNTMAGMISSRINNITRTISDQVMEQLSLIISGIVIFIISIIIYARIDKNLMIFLLIWSVLFCIIQYLNSKLIYKNVKNLTTKNNEISGQITDSFVNISNVKSFSRQKMERLILKKQGVEVLKYESSVMKAKTIANIIMFLSLSILAIFMLGYSLKLVYQGKMLIGTFLFVGQNVILTMFMLRTIFRNSVDFIQNISEIKEGLDKILEPIEITDKEDAKDLVITGGRIVFRNVSFGYPRKKNK